MLGKTLGLCCSLYLSSARCAVSTSVHNIAYLLKPIKRYEQEASLKKYRRISRGVAPETVPDVAIDALVRQLRQQIAPTDCVGF
jgi:hypothetical protein